MADLAPIVAKVIASASGMAGGLAQAEAKLRDSTGRMAKGAASAGLSAGKLFAGSMAGALATGVSFAAGTAVFNALGAAVGKAGGVLTGGADRMLAVGEAARKAGADVGGFQAVVQALGGDTATATEGLVKLKESLGKALVEGQGEAFDRLGLDAAELLGMRDDAALAKVAARLNDLGGGVAEARAGVQLFGDKFKDLRPILDDGGEYLRKTADDLRKFGASFGEGDFLQSREWSRAMNQFSLIWQGLQNQVAQGLLPILNEAADRIGSLADLGLTFDGLRDGIVDTAKAMARAGAAVYDAWADTGRITGAWDVVDAYLRRSTIQLTKFMIGAWGSAFLSFAKILPGGEKAAGFAITTAFGPLAANLKEQLDRANLDLEIAQSALELQSFGGAGADAVDRFFENVQGRGAGAVGALRDATQDLISLWEESAERLAKALEGPLDKFKESANQVLNLARTGRAASEELFLQGFGVDPFDDGLGDAGSRTLAAAFQQLLSGAGAATYQPVAAARRGSAEAFSAIQQQRYGRETVEDAIRRILEQQLEQEREQVRVGREVARAAKALNAKLGLRGI